ncbi:malate synthase A [Chengkuizengella axinellae]|uniref:Malate synthase n=1 Tax=Chengkuizengella axinellae TaxID=3064388 RepID=A0ABT9IVA4_9BACL|nr:malate synthase A [Chengkuizengella sp. 2205SS18-9]MDP5273262.1 malate synthase A [Chengkuizengella sp. 2205SS18-9]
METLVSGLQIQGSVDEKFEEILTEDALLFITNLERRFRKSRKELLHNRTIRQQKIDNGEMPDFLEETEHIRKGNWTIAPLPQNLQDRRVEITGPVDRKMIINALNSGARVFMADFEDANSPTLKNCMEGQLNLRDAVNKTITFKNTNGKKYSLKKDTAVLVVRPRGWHLEEKHITVDGEPMSASLVDFGLYFYHNAKKSIENESGPYFYLPKLESHLEGRLWNDVFVFAQNELEIPQGTIKATVLIETILAAFEMDEILYELKDHSAGLNCGRWDYIFSYIKKLRNHQAFILPDRSEVTMTVPFMRSYSLLAIQTCHRRNAPAIGGMAAQIPIKNNPEANEEAFRKVKADKEREVLDGHDGTWVAHPGLVPVALEMFNQHMPNANQINRKRNDVSVNAKDLLAVPEGKITEAGVRTNINVGIQYIESWLSGQGAAPIQNLMEDAATAEISRAQLWQWIRHPKGVLDDGRKVTLELVQQLQKEELEEIRAERGSERFENSLIKKAVQLFNKLIENNEFTDFLTLPGYKILN